MQRYRREKGSKPSQENHDGYAEALDQDKPRPKNRIGVIICGPTWLKADEKTRAWIKEHPNEKIIGRIPIAFCIDNGRNCGGLMVETDQESLPSDF